MTSTMTRYLTIIAWTVIVVSLTYLYRPAAPAPLNPLPDFPSQESYQQERAGWYFGTGRDFLDYFADFAQQRKRLIAEHDERVEDYPRQIQNHLLAAAAVWLSPILLWWGFRRRRTIIEAFTGPRERGLDI
ncbi:TPA: hypothetical protein ACP31Z_005634 [Pseudomonas aeruginosa]|nr:hypothetical protein [Pseudomonas aeruginosa]